MTTTLTLLEGYDFEEGILTPLLIIDDFVAKKEKRCAIKKAVLDHVGEIEIAQDDDDETGVYTESEIEGLIDDLTEGKSVEIMEIEFRFKTLKAIL